MRAWSCLVAAALWSSCGPAARRHVDPAHYAPRSEWTASRYAIAAGPTAVARPTAAVSRADLIEDIAFLQQMLAAAWPDADSRMGAFMRDDARDIPLAVGDRSSFCRALAEQYRMGLIAFSVDGRDCYPRGAATVSPKPLNHVPADRNYAWRIDHDGDSQIGILTIARFTDPADPGWDGLADALAELAKIDAVELDLQEARGDDPRVGLTVLAALGLDDLCRTRWHAPLVRDGDLAQVARHNHAARHPSAAAPRSRALWGTFVTEPGPPCIARSAETAVRATDRHRGLVDVLISTGCGAACALLVSAAQSQSVDVIGPMFRAWLFGDEPGLIQLPHTGVEVTFPTVRYGPRDPYLSDDWRTGASWPSHLLQVRHSEGHSRAAGAPWRGRLVPGCESLSRDPAALAHKRGGCFSPQQAAGNWVENVVIYALLDNAQTQALLASCGTTGSLTSTVVRRGYTISFIQAQTSTLERLASAPFVAEFHSSCPGSHW